MLDQASDEIDPNAQMWVWLDCMIVHFWSKEFFFLVAVYLLIYYAFHAFHSYNIIFICQFNYKNAIKTNIALKNIITGNDVHWRKHSHKTHFESNIFGKF